MAWLLSSCSRATWSTGTGHVSCRGSRGLLADISVTGRKGKVRGYLIPHAFLMEGEGGGEERGGGGMEGEEKEGERGRRTEWLC